MIHLHYDLCNPYNIPEWSVLLSPHGWHEDGRGGPKGEKVLFSHGLLLCSWLRWERDECWALSTKANSYYKKCLSHIYDPTIPQKYTDKWSCLVSSQTIMSVFIPLAMALQGRKQGLFSVPGIFSIQRNTHILPLSYVRQRIKVLNHLLYITVCFSWLTIQVMCCAYASWEHV